MTDITAWLSGNVRRIKQRNLAEERQNRSKRSQRATSKRLMSAAAT